MVGELYTEICNQDLVLLLIQNLSDFEFETKKDTISVMNYLLRKQVGKKFLVVDYIQNNTPVLDELVLGFVYFYLFYFLFFNFFYLFFFFSSFLSSSFLSSFSSLPLPSPPLPSLLLPFLTPLPPPPLLSLLAMKTPTLPLLVVLFFEIV